MMMVVSSGDAPLILAGIAVFVVAYLVAGWRPGGDRQ